MTAWLEDLEIRLTKLPLEYPKAPEGKVGEGEKVVGQVPKRLRRLWGLAQYIRSEAIRLAEDHNVKCHGSREDDSESDSCAEVRRQVQWLASEVAEVEDLYWMSLRYDLDLKDGGIDHRENWQVVSVPARKPAFPSIAIVEVTGLDFPEALSALTAERIRGRSRR